MKKVSQTILFVFVLSFAFKSTVTAQFADKSFVVSSDKIKSYLEFEKSLKVDDTSGPEDNLKTAVNAKVLKASFKASENFKKHFKGAANVNWSVQEDAIVGAFSKDDVKTNVVYNKRGSWIHTLVYSNESTMPGKIRSLIEDVYPGYEIKLCVEIYESNLLFHIVQIENKKMFKQLGIYDGQIDVLQQFAKPQL